MARPVRRPDLDAALQLRMPQALKDRLEAEADARVLSVSLLVTKLLEESLDHLVPVGELTRWPAVVTATGEQVPAP